MNKAIEYKGLSNVEFVGFLRDGDELAFNEIYNRYKGILLVHAYKKLGDYDEAKDVMQDMFSWIWNRRESIPHTENIAGYLYTTTRNNVLNAIVHKNMVSRYEKSFGKFIDEGKFTSDLLIREKELAGIIECEIQAMPPKMKEVFIRSRKFGVSYRKISEQMGITSTAYQGWIIQSNWCIVAYKSMFKIIRKSDINRVFSFSKVFETNTNESFNTP